MPEKPPTEAQNVPLPLLDNSPAVQSDPNDHHTTVAAHLANERTFLAWSFTSLFIMGGGVALARTLIALNTSPLTSGTGSIGWSLFYPTTLGLLFLTAGLVIIIMAACRYMSVEHQIMHRCHRPGGTWVLIYVGIILLLGAVVAGFLLQMRGALQ